MYCWNHFVNKSYYFKWCFILLVNFLLQPGYCWEIVEWWNSKHLTVKFLLFVWCWCVLRDISPNLCWDWKSIKNLHVRKCREIYGNVFMEMPGLKVQAGLGSTGVKRSLCSKYKRHQSVIVLLQHVCACWDFTASLYRWLITSFTNPAYPKSHLVVACSIASKKKNCKS